MLGLSLAGGCGSKSQLAQSVSGGDAATDRLGVDVREAGVDAQRPDEGMPGTKCVAGAPFEVVRLENSALAYPAVARSGEHALLVFSEVTAAGGPAHGTFARSATVAPGPPTRRGPGARM